jgi:NADPH-dependent 2,4-dienoyl-CoA reductase/sulfur reductase-like enzyme/rhodanese-related sulfurtransferase
MNPKLIVIGGVAAGPKAASKAKRCNPDMEIVIYQEEGAVSYGGCGLPYYLSGRIKERKQLLARTAEQFSKDGIQVRLGHRVDEINLREKTIAGTQLGTGSRFTDRYDKLVLATGSQAIRPRVEGLELKNVFFLRSIFDADRLLPAVSSGDVRNVVVVGGGYIGLEMAESLTEIGKKVTLIELAPQILTLFDEDLAALVHRHLEKKGVQVLTGEGLKGILGRNGQVARVQTASREIEAEAVLLSLGVRPQVALAQRSGLRIGETGAIWVNERMETSAENVFSAGDCTETTQLVTGKKTWIPLGSTANKQGRVVGINVCGGSAAFPGVLGTAIFKAFAFKVAKTGLNMKEAAKDGLRPIQAIVRGYDGAHYYPGMKESVLKVIADQKTGLILGAQAAGEGPSDKFIDIVAMALLGGMDCKKLGAADLAYAPPFSPALSPVISAAHVLQNKLEGRFEWTTAEEVKDQLGSVPKDFMVLDVREEKEVKERRIPGSTWVPLDQLESRFQSLDRRKKTAVHCHSGLRSYKAVLKMKHAGFQNVKNLDGGLLGWNYELEGPAEKKGK